MTIFHWLWCVIVSQPTRLNSPSHSFSLELLKSQFRTSHQRMYHYLQCGDFVEIIEFLWSILHWSYIYILSCGEDLQEALDVKFIHRRQHIRGWSSRSDCNSQFDISPNNLVTELLAVTKSDLGWWIWGKDALYGVLDICLLTSGNKSEIQIKDI